MIQRAKVNYHIKSDSRQAFLFDLDGEIGNLVSPELISAEVNINDVRDNMSAINFESDGIQFVQHASKIKVFEGLDDWQTTYNQEVEQLLGDTINAKEVIVFDHTVRVDDPNAVRKPARNVHTDYSMEGAEQRLVDIVGEQKAREFQAGRFAFVNVWRPVRNTIKSSPLGFIRPTSMRAEDWMKIDLIYPDRRGEILGVSENKNHEWLYLSEMTPDEVVIFNIYDNADRPYVAHSALDFDNTEFATVPRRSIETRTLVRYD